MKQGAHGGGDRIPSSADLIDNGTEQFSQSIGDPAFVLGQTKSGDDGTSDLGGQVVDCLGQKTGEVQLLDVLLSLVDVAVDLCLDCVQEAGEVEELGLAVDSKKRLESLDQSLEGSMGLSNSILNMNSGTLEELGDEVLDVLGDGLSVSNGILGLLEEALSDRLDVSEEGIDEVLDG